MPPKDRQQVNDLQMNQLVPQATPAGLDFYQRPGAPEIEKQGWNQFQMLSDALTPMVPLLALYGAKKYKEYTAEQMASAESTFYANREAANEMIRKGEFPEGASPYWQRGLQRASLKQHGALLASQMQQAFFGKEGDEARNSNDPAVMQQFIDNQVQAYGQKNLFSEGGKSLFSPLDLQEIYNPAIEHASQSMMQAHANYRVKEQEQNYRALAGANIGTALDTHIGSLAEDADKATRTKARQDAGQAITDTFMNHDTGLVSNGLSTTEANRMIVDIVTARAMESGNRAYLDVLDEVKPGNGPKVSDLPYAREKRLQAEEYITQKANREEAHQWALEDRPHTIQLHAHQEEAWKREDERYAQEKIDDAARRDDKATLQSMERRLYEGLRSTDSKRGVRIIDEVLMDAEKRMPEQAEHLRGIVKSFTQRRMETMEDDAAIVRMRARIVRDPLSVKQSEIVGMLGKTANRGTVEGLISELDRQQGNAEHPFIRQPEFQGMLQQISKGVLRNFEDEFSTEGQLRIGTAVGSFRDKAQAWIEANPKGTLSQFMAHMRANVKQTMEESHEGYADMQAATKQTAIDKADQIEAWKQGKASPHGPITVQEPKRFFGPSVPPPLTAKNIDEGLSRVQRHDLFEARPENRREMLEGIFSERFIQRGQTYEQMSKEIDKYLGAMSPKPGTQAPTKKASTGHEPISAKDFGRLQSSEQRRQVINAPNDDARRKLLTEMLGPQFEVRGQSREEMQQEISLFLILLGDAQAKKRAEQASQASQGKK